MKQKFTIRQIVLTSFILIISISGYTQPDYDFRNPVLESGTGYNVGATYRFSDTKPGIDALVTITGYSGGLILEDIDGGSGYVEAFQPVIRIPSGSNGFIDFTIVFVIGGTSTPMIQTEVPATPIDVDGKDYGSGLVWESDEFDMGPGGYVNYDMTGGEIVVTQSGNIVNGTNIAAIDYPGVDTTPRQVMFTVVNSNISTFYYRVGGKNTSSFSQRRLRSVYFKKFWYNNALLATSGLQYFSGVNNSNDVKLSIGISSNAYLKSIVVEKSTDGKKFSSIGDIIIGPNSMAYNEQYVDHYATEKAKYYRLKLVSENGAVSYSKTLVFISKTSSINGLKVYPNIIQSDANISLISDKKQVATLNLYDFSGRMVKHQSIQVEQGNNGIKLDRLDGLTDGNYVLVMNIGSERYSQQIVKR